MALGAGLGQKMPAHTRKFVEGKLVIKAAAIILAAIGVVAAIAIVFRWQIAANSSGVYLLDRWTGTVVECHQPILGRKMDCF